MGDVIGLSTGFGEAIRSAEKIDKHFEDWIKMSQQITTNLKNAFSQQGGDLFGGSLSKAQGDIFNLENIKIANKNFTDMLDTLMKITNYMSSSKSLSQELFDPTKIYASNESLTKLQEILNSTEGRINKVSEAFKKLYGVQESLNSATAQQDKKNARSSAISFLGEQGITVAKNTSTAVIQAKLKEVEEILKTEEKSLIEEKRIAEETIKFNSSTAAEQIGIVRKTVDSILKEEERKRKEIQKSEEAYAKHSEAMLKNELENESFNQKRMAQIRKEASAERKADIESAFREEDARRENAEDYAKYEEEVYNRSLEKQREINRMKVAEDRAAYDERKRDIESAFREEEQQRKQAQKEAEAYAKHSEQMLQNELSTESMAAKQKEKIRQEESKQRLSDIKEAFSAEEKRINDIITRYKNLQSLLSSNLSAKNAFEKVGVSNLDANEKAEYQGVLDREKSLRAQIEQMEVKHQDILIDIKTRYADKDSKRVAASASNRLKKEEEDWQNYLSSVAGATDLSDDAKSINDQKEAIKYLIIARDNLSSSTQNYDKIIKDLNNRIQKHRINIEQATKAEENENTILPKVANEYARILKEIDKLTEAKQKLESTKAYTQGDAQAVNDYAAIEARLQDLNARRQDIEDSAQGQLDEIQRKHLAIRAQDNINALAKQEEEIKKKAEEFAAKYDAISRTDALSAIGQSYNTQNIAQAEKAIQDLKEARDKLDNTDTDYADTVAQLNEEIQRQEEYIKSVTKAEQYQKEQEDKANRTMSGAMSYSKKAKSIEEVKRAMDYLQSAMNKEDISTKKGKENYKAMSTELERLKKMYTNVTGESMKFSNVVESLGGKLKTVFGLTAIQRYVNEIVKVRKEFELQNRALQAILMDANKANALWDKTVALAVQSPFTVKQLVTYTKQLAAYRIESDKLYDTTKMLADVSAGLGVDMDRLILAYGQVRAASYLRGTELRQFTEAGIPMLEELAKRFTELEDKTVSVGEVFSRISKRMVSFNDVAEVFKNLTEEGGTFYRMQEIQAETLYGQLSNLRDAMDIMFNEIGKANDGVLKNTVSILRSIISNFREWAALLKIVGLTMAAISFRNFTRGMISVIKYGAATTKVMKGLTAAGGKTAIAFKSLAKAVTNHPFVAAGAAIVALGTILLNHISAVNATNKKYDELAVRQYSGINKFKELSKTIEKNNAVIKENLDATDDNVEAKKKLQEAQEGNKTAVEELNKLYPESTKLIITEKDGIVDYNKALQEQIRLQLLSAEIAKEGGAGFLYQDIQTNYNQASDALSKFANQVESVKAKSIEASIAVGKQYKEGIITEDEYNNTMSVLDKIASGTKEELLSIRGEFNNLPIYILNSFKPLVNEYDKLITRNQQYGNRLSDLGENIKRQAPEYKAAMESFNLDSEEGKKDAAKWIDSQLDALGIVNDEIVNWARKEIEKHINVRLIWDKQDTDLTLTSWRKAYMDLFGGDIFKYTFTDDIVEQDTVIDQLNSVYKDTKELVERMKKAAGDAYSDMDIEAETKKMEQLRKQLAWFGVDPDATNAAKSQADWIAKMISLVKDMNNSYEDLNKTFDKTPSKMNTITSFEDAFKETFGKTGLKIGDLDFTTPEGVAAFLEKLLPYAKTLGSKYVQELQKAIADYKVEIGVTLKQDADKEIIKDTEALFDRYTKSLELKELQIPSDIAKDLFKVDYIDLKGLRKELEATKDKFIGTDMEKEYEKFIEKLNDLEVNASVERMKTYSKYLYEGMSERVKLKIEELKKLKEVEESPEFQPQQKERIKEGIRKDASIEQQKQMWTDFKNSEMYTMMFEDMENMGTKAVEILRNKLKELKSSLADLPANEMKEIVNQLNKADELLLTRNPFKSMRDSMKEIRELRKKGLTEDVVQKNLATALAEKQNYESELDVINKIIACQGDQVKLNELNNSLTEEQKKYLKMNVNELNIMANDLRDNADIQDEAITTAKAQVLQYVKARQALQASNEQWADIVNLTKKGLDGIKDIVGLYTTDAYGIGETIGEAAGGMLDLVAQGVQFYFQLQMMTAQAELFETTMNAAMGPIGWIVLGIQGIATIWKAIADVSSKQLQKRIDEHLDTVEKLQKSYEKLQDQIEEAYSTRQLTEFYKQSRENTQKQMQEVQAAITALEGTKKANQKGSEEYEQLQDLKEKLEELQEQLEQVGKDAFSNFTDGVLDDTISAAQSWTDSWLNAFEETGDGLSGLEEDFDDMLMSIAKKQAANLITGTYVKRWENELRKYIDPDKDDLTLTVTEAQRWAEEVRKTLPELSDALEAYLGSIAEITNSGNSLSGLEKGIQGMTEEQADILAAYWNSVRQYVADINIKMDSVIGKITINEENNPMLNQLKNIATKIDRIYDLMDTLTANYPEGGIGLKVITA